ncbi:MAG TPA: MotA/TolQ/ExbB proton channel family protein [Chlamydiales bacterium]|nr:MotA/TolQ/ExbB proton channel family protein [Chlamydiales bacterium]
MVLASRNPFVSSYVQSDWFGKGVFLGLFLLSAISWWVLIHKIWIFFQLKRLSRDFMQQFSEKDPLGLQFLRPLKRRLLEVPHPFFEVYKILKQHALQIISRNQFYCPEENSFLSEEDMGLIESRMYAAMTSQAKKLEKNLFILSTIVTLGPFLGLLGTVWGILVTFSDFQGQGLASANNASMLSGLSLALTTTVVGLLVAIPALVGYNYLKNLGNETRRELEDFSHHLLTALQLHYRKPQHAKTDCPNT